MFEGESVLRAVKRAVVLATLLAVAVNICEIMHLWVFSATPTDWNRAMGLQDDPNAAGMVIVFGCVIGLTEVPRRFRELFIVACAAGIVPTFSREAMGAFAVLILCASLGRALSTPRLLIIVSLAIVAIFAWNLSTILDRQGILTDENLGRLTMQVSDASAQDHARIAQKVWHQFELAPLIGNGFGTTAYWNDNQSHNLYLSFMADHGILGVLLVPALVWCLAYGSWDYYAFAFGFLIWCMFNHNLFANPFGILTLAIMANQQAYFRSSLVPRFQFRSVVTY
jgi:hypothetical protein